MDLHALTLPHNRFAVPGSVKWSLTPDGISIDGAAPEGTGGQPVTVGRIWRDFGPAIVDAGIAHNVPVELIVATIATETRGMPQAIRIEPGYVSDEATPHLVSPGLMQTLISTARFTLGDPTLDRAWLLIPANSINAGTSYIAQQHRDTGYDPPLVACAYNAGGVYRQDSPGNRWRMKQYPIGTGDHADRFVRWFNDCLALFNTTQAPAGSFWQKMRA